MKPKTDNYISLQEAAKCCEHSQEYLSLRARQGKLRAVKIGRNWVIKKEWLEEYLTGIEEYNNNLKTKKTKPARIGYAEGVAGGKVIKVKKVKVKVKKVEKEVLVPKNLPIGEFQLAEVRPLHFRVWEVIQEIAGKAARSPAFRFGFAWAMVFVLIIAGTVFGRTSLEDVFKGVSYLAETVGTAGNIVIEETIAAPVKESFSTVCEDVEIGLFKIESKISKDEIYSAAVYGTINAFKEYGQWLGGGFKNQISKIKKAPPVVATGKAFGFVWQNIKKGYVATDNFIGENFSVVGNRISQFGERVVNGAKEFVKGIRGIYLAVTDGLCQAKALASAFPRTTRFVFQSFQAGWQNIREEYIAVNNYIEEKTSQGWEGVKGLADQVLDGLRFIVQPWRILPSKKIVIDKAKEMKSIWQELEKLKEEGLIGLTGPPGPVGPPGSQGSQGSIGPTGLGLTGSRGSRGNRGPQGPPGNAGLTGSFSSGGNIAAGAITAITTATPQLKAGYDSSNYSSLSVDSAGDLTLTATGGDITTSGNLAVTGDFTVSGAQTYSGAGGFITTTTPQLKVGYNDSNYSALSVDANGDLTLTATGGDILLGTDNITTSGTGRFDGGIAIGNIAESNTFLIETSDASDPVLSFRTTDILHQVDMYLDEDMVTDKIKVAGQVVGKHTSLQLEALDGQSAAFYLASGSSYSYLVHASDDSLQLTNATQDEDIIFTVNKGSADTEIMRIDGSAGYIGIATTTPATLLHLSPSSGTSELRIETADTNDPTLSFKTTNTAQQMNIYLDESMINDELVFEGQTAGLHSNVNIRAADGKNATLYLTSGGNFSYISYLSSDNLLLANYEGDKDIIFNVMKGVVDTEIMRIDGSAGNVGIGVTDPDTQLEVLYDGTQLKLSYDASNYITFATQSDGDLTIDSNKASYDLDFGDGNLTTTGTGQFAQLGVGIAPDANKLVHVLMSATNEMGFYVDGETNPYTGSEYSHMFRGRRTYDYGTNDFDPDIVGTLFYVTHESSDAKLTANRQIIIEDMLLTIDGKVTNNTTDPFNLYAFSANLKTDNNATYDSSSTGTIRLQNRNFYSVIDEDSTFSATGGTVNNRLDNEAFYAWVQSNPTLSSGNLIIQNVGLHVLIAADTTVGGGAGWAATINYGIYLESITGGDAGKNWGIWDTSGANWGLDSDDQKIIWGEDLDYSIEWDGNDAVHTITAGDFVFTGGNVGIGTASPDADLDIEAAEDTEFIRLTDSTNTDSVGIYTGTGTPNTSLAAQAGSIFLDQLGATYVNTDGSTAWTQLTGGSFRIPAYEVIDPISGEEIEVGDFVLGTIDDTLDDGGLHGLWTKWDNVKQELLEEIFGALDEDGSTVSTATESTEDVGEIGLWGSFIQKIKQALASLGLFIQDGIAQVKEIITEKLFVKTARIEKMEMVDQKTGDIYCTWIESGEMKRVKGECSTIEFSGGSGDDNQTGYGEDQTGYGGA